MNIDAALGARKDVRFKPEVTAGLGQLRSLGNVRYLEAKREVQNSSTCSPDGSDGAWIQPVDATPLPNSRLHRNLESKKSDLRGMLAANCILQHEGLSRLDKPRLQAIFRGIRCSVYGAGPNLYRAVSYALEITLSMTKRNASSTPPSRLMVVGAWFGGIASVGGLVAMILLAINKVSAGHGLDTYRTKWMVEDNWIGFLVFVVVTVDADRKLTHF